MNVGQGEKVVQKEAFLYKLEKRKCIVCVFIGHVIVSLEQETAKWTSAAGLDFSITKKAMCFWQMPFFFWVSQKRVRLT